RDPGPRRAPPRLPAARPTDQRAARPVGASPARAVSREGSRRPARRGRLRRFNERAHAGRFDAMLNTVNTDPTPSSGVPQSWTRAGFGGLNYGRYENPAFARLVDRAVTSVAGRDEAKRTWRAAIEVLNQDAPAIFLFATENAAAVHRRVADV